MEKVGSPTPTLSARSYSEQFENHWTQVLGQLLEQEMGEIKQPAQAGAQNR